jgi:uncharacterized membrane protein (GlpM family)
MGEYLLRFMIGGFAVSVFAALADVFRPKSFAGLFGAAPSIALATLAIAAWTKGRQYVSIEARSMIFGAIGLCVYCLTVCYLLKRVALSTYAATAIALISWLACTFALKIALLG